MTRRIMKAVIAALLVLLLTACSSISSVPDPVGSYTSRDDVALYLDTYGRLPVNFMTKDEAEALGWPGGDLTKYAPGKSIGGDRFGNYEGVLPTDK